MGLKDVVAKNVICKDKLVTAERLVVILAVEYLLHPMEIPSGYPFVLPYFDNITRTTEVGDMQRRIVLWNASHNFGVKAILDLGEKLEKLLDTHRVLLWTLRLDVSVIGSKK